MREVSSLLQFRLKDAGFSLTAPRRLVFEMLSNNAPLTMNALWKQLESKVDRASVYRTVALFEKLGIVRRISRGWKYTLELSDEFVPHHHHLTCLKCGRIINIDEPTELDNMLSKIGADHKFKIGGHTLEIEGLCSLCQG